MKKLTFFLTLAALVVYAVSATPAHGASPLKTPPPEQIWAFFEALPDVVLPQGIATQAERASFNKEYHEHLAEVAALQEEEEDYGDYLEEIGFQLFWNPTILDPVWMQDVAEDLTEENGPMQSIILSVYPGSDPDQLFGILELREFNSDYGSTLVNTQCYWYSVSQKKVTATAMPLDVPFTDDDLTDDGLLLYQENELYWVMRDHRIDWLEEPDRLIVMLQTIGATPVCYNWDGRQFVRDRSYSPLPVHSFGIGRISFGDPIPFGIHGYTVEWIEQEEDYIRAWQYIKDGETDPRFVIYAYGNGNATVDAIEVMYPNYKLLDIIQVGMPAAKAMEAFKEYYSWEEVGGDSYVSEFDGKAWIFSGHDDPFQLGVDPKYVKNGKLSPDAKISVIRIAPAVG